VNGGGTVACEKGLYLAALEQLLKIALVIFPFVYIVLTGKVELLISVVIFPKQVVGAGFRAGLEP
jgi:hypothetical protein